MEYLDFDKILENNTKDYDGAHSFAISRSAELYRLATNLLIDDDINRETRAKLFSVVGYFIIPQDLYPEDIHGPIGYVDDLMLLIVVLRELREKEGAHKLYYHWEHNEMALDTILDTEFESMIASHTELYKELIEFMGF